MEYVPERHQSTPEVLRLGKYNVLIVFEALFWIDRQQEHLGTNKLEDQSNLIKVANRNITKLNCIQIL